MTIQCPHCQNPIGLKAVRPGRYATKCPRCSEQFQLTVPDEPGQSPTVNVLRSEAPAANGTAERAAIDEPKRNVSPSPDEPARPAATARDFVVFGTRPKGVPAFVGGYQILRALGRGGLGAVYLARHLAPGRYVALKVMKPEWANNPTFVSRFTREAYAAAQFVHHNVVPIHDLGAHRRTRYVSVEFVPGRTLAALVRAQATLAPDVAAAYVLQAARGLKLAHEQSLIHRDIKPANLMLDDQGVVKVADLGLVKTPTAAEAEVAAERGSAAVVVPARSAGGGDGPATIASAAMGTPAYMAPEQARDALGADARADIYSLGCTLYELVTGQPPFEGKTAVELIAKHQHEPIVPPERFAPRVPGELSAIIMTMIAKKPEDRYANLGDVIRALEVYLGVPAAGVFAPREEDANLLAESVHQFNAAPAAQRRTMLLFGGAGACAVIVLLSLLAHQFHLAAGFFGLGVMSALAYFVIDGVTRKSELFDNACALVFGGTAGDWLTIAAGVVLIFGLVLVFKMFWPLTAFGVLAVLIAWGVHTTLDRNVQAERQPAVEQVRQMIRGMRLQGIDEETIRQFVCKCSGARWEAFYEALFGNDAKRLARARWARDEHGRRRPAFGVWRDWLIRGIEAKLEARRDARHKALFETIEEKALEAQGVNLLTARRKGRRIAAALVVTASELRASARAAEVHGGERLSIGRALKHATERPEDILVEQESGPAGLHLDGPLNLLLGGRTRFLAGAALIAGCLLWMHQNQILDTEQIKATAKELQAAAEKAKESNDVGVVLDQKIDVTKHIRQEAIERAHEPLSLPGLPGPLRALFNSFNPGVAGLILVVSSFFQGWRMSLFAIPGAAITLLGPPLLGVPSSEPLHFKNLLTMALGGVVLIVGFLFGRTR